MTATDTTAPAEDTRPYTHEMHVTREAVDVIARCNNRVTDIGRYFGESSEEYRKAEESWRHNLSHLFGMFFGSESWISRDGDLSLFTRTSSRFVHGLIFHAVPRRCTKDGCKAYAHDDGHVFHYGTYDNTGVLDHEHEWSIPLDAPRPGTWSFHS